MYTKWVLKSERKKRGSQVGWRRWIIERQWRKWRLFRRRITIVNFSTESDDITLKLESELDAESFCYNHSRFRQASWLVSRGPILEFFFCQSASWNSVCKNRHGDWCNILFDQQPPLWPTGKAFFASHASVWIYWTVGEIVVERITCALTAARCSWAIRHSNFLAQISSCSSLALLYELDSKLLNVHNHQIMSCCTTHWHPPIHSSILESNRWLATRLDCLYCNQYDIIERDQLYQLPTKVSLSLSLRWSIDERNKK